MTESEPAALCLTLKLTTSHVFMPGSPTGRAWKHGLPLREAAEGLGDTFHTLSQCLQSRSDLGPQLHSLGLVPAFSTENFTMGLHGILGKATMASLHS